MQAKEEDLLLYGFDKNEPLFSTKAGYGKIGRGNTRRQTYAAMVTRMDLICLKSTNIDVNHPMLFQVP